MDNIRNSLNPDGFYPQNQSYQQQNSEQQELMQRIQQQGNLHLQHQNPIRDTKKQEPNWESLDMDSPEDQALFHGYLFQTSLDPETSDLPNFIKSDLLLLEKFKKSVQSKPEKCIRDFIKDLCFKLFSENDLPGWLKNKPRDILPRRINLLFHGKKFKHPLSIGNDLLKQCSTGEPLINLEDLKQLTIQHWLTLKDEQGRSPLHILFSHNEINKSREALAFELVQLCPALMTIHDHSEATPIDILFRKKELKLIEKLLNNAFPHNETNPSKTKSYLASTACLCHAQDAKAVLQKLNIDVKASYQQEQINPELINSLPLQHNPIAVCGKLNKHNLAKRLLKYFHVEDWHRINKERCHASLFFLLGAVAWKATSLIPIFLASLEDPSARKVKLKVIDPLLCDVASKMIQLGCILEAEQLINWRITIDQSLPIKYTDKLIARLSYSFYFAPQLIAAKDILKKCSIELTDHAFFFAIKSIITTHLVSKKFQTDEHIEALSLLIKELVNKKEECTALPFTHRHSLVTEIHLPALFPLLFEKNQPLVNDLINTLKKMEYKNSIIFDVCHGFLLFSHSSCISEKLVNDLFNWLIPLLDENGLSADLSDALGNNIMQIIFNHPNSRVGLSILNYFINKSSRTAIQSLLEKLNCEGLTPFELIRECHNEEESQFYCSLLKALVRHKLVPIKNNNVSLNQHLPLIYFFYGDEELHQLTGVDKIDWNALIFYRNKIKSYSPFGIKKFLSLFKLLPLETQKSVFNLDKNENEEVNDLTLENSLPFRINFIFYYALKSGDLSLVNELFSLHKDILGMIENPEFNLFTLLISMGNIHESINEKTLAEIFRPIDEIVWKSSNSNHLSLIRDELGRNPLTHLRDKPEIIQFIIQRYFEGIYNSRLLQNSRINKEDTSQIKFTQEQIKTNIKLRSIIYKEINKNTLNKLAEEENLLPANASSTKCGGKVVSIEFEKDNDKFCISPCYQGIDNELIYIEIRKFNHKNNSITIEYGHYTLQGILKALDKIYLDLRITEQIKNINDNSYLKDKFSDILLDPNTQITREVFLEKANTPCRVINRPGKAALEVIYIDHTTRSIRVKKFSYYSANIIDEIDSFIKKINDNLKNHLIEIKSSLPPQSIFSNEPYPSNFSWPEEKTCYVYIHPTGLFTKIAHKIWEPNTKKTLFPLNLSIQFIPSKEELLGVLELLGKRALCLECALSLGASIRYDIKETDYFSPLMWIVRSQFKLPNSPFWQLLDINHTKDVIQKLICFTVPNNELMFMLDYSKKREIKDSAEEMLGIRDAISKYRLSYHKAKNISFNEIKTLIHNTPAPIDLDLLNQTLNSLMGTDYLKNFLLLNKNISLDSLVTNLKNLISNIKTHTHIKDLKPHESKHLAIQLTHILHDLNNKNDTNELHRFTCDLALMAQYCGPRIAETIDLEYMSRFNLIEGPLSESGNNFDTVLVSLYKEAIFETVNTLLKFVLDPQSKSQTIHVRAYLWTTLKELINMPTDPQNAHIEDKYQNLFGLNDFSKDNIQEIYEGFFIPILIQTVKHAGSIEILGQKDKIEGFDLLTDGFIEAIGSSTEVINDTNLKEQLDKIENKKQERISKNLIEVHQAEDEVKKLIAQEPSFSLQQGIQKKCQMLDEKINLLALEVLRTRESLEQIDKEIALLEDEESPEHKPLIRKKRKYSQITSTYEGITEGNLLLEEKIRIEHHLKELNNTYNSLKNQQNTLKQTLDIAEKKSNRIKFFEFEDKIKKCQEEKLDIIKQCNFEKREKMFAYCVEKKWLIEDETLGVYSLTEAGASKLLELKQFLVTK